MKLDRTRLLVAMLAAAACARPLPPPGGKQDRMAPQLVSTQPEQLAVVKGWTKPVTFKFDERISEKGITDQLAIVSPDTLAVEVHRSGAEIQVRPKDGWQPDRIYQVVLQPAFSDLFGNQRKEPAMVVFSTGPAIPSTVIAGLVRDRISSRPVSGARVEARQGGTTPLTYVTVTDSGGFYALRHVPAGAYTVTIFQDQNRNGKPDGREAWGEVNATLKSAGDTAVLNELSILPRDTTPARLTRAEVRDSMQIRLTIDDYLDPHRPLEAQAVLWKLPDSTQIPIVRLYYPKDFEATRPRPAATRSDSSRVAAAPSEPAEDTARVPTQELVLVPATPLPPKSRIRVELRNLTNINGLPGGGGSVATETPAASTPPAARAAPAGGRDTTRATPRAPTDTSRTVPRAPTDTSRAAPRPDTSRAAPRQDTSRAAPRPDTARAVPRPDTSRAAPRGRG
ncbi:MAG TPA: Ig-like domain-containing protein [Longimicrobiales bacterium]|nr:Ig-like domain-containing protein [Longimicrobiales bacterium]